MDSLKNIFYLLTVVVGVPMAIGLYMFNQEDFVFDIFGVFFILFVCWIIIGWIKSFLKKE